MLSGFTNRPIFVAQKYNSERLVRNFNIFGSKNQAKDGNQTK
jgi:hypothetical protein